MTFSVVGRKLFAALGAFVFTDIIVLALSVRVNIFQEFFFVADLFPLALSIITLVVFVSMIFLDFSLNNSFTARPPFMIGTMAVFSVLWLAFNVFSTSRWRQVPMACSTIPAEYSDEKTWCMDLQALKAFVWIEWVILSSTLLFTSHYVISQHTRGQTHIFSTPFSRYSPRPRELAGGNMYNTFERRESEFVQYTGQVQYPIEEQQYQASQPQDMAQYKTSEPKAYYQTTRELQGQYLEKRY